MKNIKRIMLAAVFTVLGSAVSFADLISPGPSGNSSDQPVTVSAPQGSSASQGGVIMIVILAVAAAVVFLIAMISKRGNRGGKEPAGTADAAAAEASSETDEEIASGLDEENQMSAEIMQSDVEIAQTGPEMMGSAPEVNSADSGSAGLGGEVAGDLG